MPYIEKRERKEMFNLMAVFVGGGLGSVCRYLVGLCLPTANFPFSTLLANICACFILGYLAGYLLKNSLSDQWKLLIGTGFCGGFSTFSTFSKETLDLTQKNWVVLGGGYVVLSLILGILAVYLGVLAASLRS